MAHLACLLIPRFDLKFFFQLFLKSPHSSLCLKFLVSENSNELLSIKTDYFAEHGSSFGSKQCLEKGFQL